MNLKLLIVEDEDDAIQLLQHFIQELGMEAAVSVAKNHQNAMELLEDQVFDLILLDIHLPDQKGISIAQLYGKKTPVIFTTANAEYAVEGFNVSALDFLLKPISFARFKESMDKFLAMKSAMKQTLNVKSDRKRYQLKLTEIFHLEAYGDYVKIHMLDGKMILTKNKLSKLEMELPSDFLRVHRSHVISKNQIEYLDGNQVKVAEHMIPIGQSYRERLLSYLS